MFWFALGFIVSDIPVYVVRWEDLAPQLFKKKVLSHHHLISISSSDDSDDEMHSLKKTGFHTVFVHLISNALLEEVERNPPLITIELLLLLLDLRLCVFQV